MQHDRDRTQIKTGDFEYSHGRHIFQDAIRGFVAGTRGWLEGRKLQRDARTDREKRIADEAYRQRTLDMQERKANMDDAFQNRQLTAQTDIQTVLADVQSRLAGVEEGKLIETERAGKAGEEIQREQLRNARELSDEQLNLEYERIYSAEGMQDKALDSRRKEITHEWEQRKLVTQMGLDADREKWTAQQTHDFNILDKQIQANKQIVQDQLDSAEKLAEIAARNALDVVGAQTEGEISVEGAKNQQELDMLQSKYLLGQMGVQVGTVPEDLRTAYFQMMTQLGKQISYKIAAVQRGAYGRGMTAYIGAREKNNNVSDVALINAFQQMVDPGVSVREGEVRFIQTTGSYGDRIAVWQQKVLRGGVLSNNQRDQIADMMRAIWNTSTDTWNNHGEKQFIESGIKAIGLEPYLKIPEFHRQESSLEDIRKERNPFLGWPVQGATSPTASGGTTPAGEQPSGQTQESPDTQEMIGGVYTKESLQPLVKDAVKYLKEGKSFYDIMTKIQEDVFSKESDLTPEQLKEIMDYLQETITNAQAAAIATGGFMEEAPPALPGDPEAVNSFQSAVDPSRLTVADVEDTEQYRQLRVRFLPDNFRDMTTAEWEAQAQALIAEMTQEGVPEDVAKAFVDKIRATFKSERPTANAPSFMEGEEQ